MLKRLLVVCTLLATLTLVYAQGLTTVASKDDWEEINFATDSAILTDGFPSLLRLAELLNQNPGYKVKVEGHTDSRGSDRHNDKLAMNRANAVKDFLVKYGASPNQIEVAGSGKRNPKSDNKTREGRFMNRRVTLTVTDPNGRIVSATGISEAIRAIPAAIDELKAAQQKCCSDILRRLDRLDEILAMLRDLQGLKAEVESLKKANADIRRQVDAIPAAIPRGPDRNEIADITRTTASEAIEKARMPRFSLLGANIGADGDGKLTFTGKGRFFAPFREKSAFQAEAEYLYFRDRKEGQFDFGLVNRIHPRFQAGGFASFKHVILNGMQSGGTLGQGAITLDYIFKQGRLGLFGTKSFMDGGVVNNILLSRNIFEQTYLKVIDQVGASGTIGLVGNTYVEGNLGYLKSRGYADRPGGTLKFVFPVNQKLAFTLEGGMNESLLSRENTGRVVAGLQFGNFLKPKEYMGVETAVPAAIPRVRYELLTRRVRTGNDAPVADAGPDQLGVQAGTITLDGSASYDPDGDPITFQWTQIAGPSVAISNATSAKAQFQAAEGQSYSFRLTVKDPSGAQSIARVNITTSKPEPVQPVRILRFAANPATIRPGQSSTIVWEVENADEVNITGIGRVNPRGSSSVSPADTTQYRITARNRLGEVNETLTITVDRPDARVLACTAQPMNILAGESATLLWATQNADSVTITGLGTVDASGSRVVSPSETTTYTVTATNRFGSATCNVRVQVTPGQMPRILSFVAAPREINKGQATTLTWNVENATDISIGGVGSGLGRAGNVDVRPDSNVSYTLTARNRYGEVSATVSVSVVEPATSSTPKPLSLTGCAASPATLSKPGDATTLTWSTVSATTVTLSGIEGSVPPNGPVVVRPTADTTYTVTAVNGYTGERATCQIKVTVKKPDLPVPVIAGPSQIEVFSREFVLDGSQSSSPSGGPLTFRWESLQTGPVIIDQGKPVTRVQLPGMFGVYQIRLTVTDQAGQSASTIISVIFRSSTLP